MLTEKRPEYVPVTTSKRRFKGDCKDLVARFTIYIFKDNVLYFT